MASVLASPFGVEPVDEIPLNRAPLVTVLAQIQFPRLSALLGGGDAINAYASAIRGAYPILKEQQNVVLTVTPEGLTQQPGPSKVWVFLSVDETWRIGIGDSSLVLETSEYMDRAQFCARFAQAVEPFIGLVGMPYVTRLGVRYINRLSDPEDIDDLAELFRAPVNGIMATELPPHVRVEQSLSQSVYRLEPDDGLLARWGLLPPNAVIEPTLSPTPTPSFVLDLDAFREYSARRTPHASDIAADANELAGRAYRYFRWAVTDVFLDRFGARK